MVRSKAWNTRTAVTLTDDDGALIGTTDSPLLTRSADPAPVFGPQLYTLLTAASATGSRVNAIRGGTYIWRVEGTWGGGSATLQMLGLDGVTWKNVRNQGNTADLTASADSSMAVTIGQGASLRVVITGTVGPVSSTLAGVS